MEERERAARVVSTLGAILGSVAALSWLGGMVFWPLFTTDSVMGLPVSGGVICGIPGLLLSLMGVFACRGRLRQISVLGLVASLTPLWSTVCLPKDLFVTSMRWSIRHQWVLNRSRYASAVSFLRRQPATSNLLPSNLQDLSSDGAALIYGSGKDKEIQFRMFRWDFNREAFLVYSPTAARPENPDSCHIPLGDGWLMLGACEDGERVED